MKMKNILLFTVNLLAAASLGLALPQKPQHTPHNTPLGTPAASHTVVSTPILPATKVPAAVHTPAVPAALPAGLPATPDALGKVLAAAGGSSVSKDCAAAIVTLVTDPEFLKCIPVTAFTPILPILTDPNFVKNFIADPPGTFKKIEPPFVQFSTAFCAAPKCSDDLVNKAIKTLSDSCSAELKDNALIKSVFSMIVFYSPMHDSICFKTQKGDQFCWDNTLTTVFSLPKSPIKIVDGAYLDAVAVADPAAVCTRCNKDIINTFFNFLTPDNKLAFQILQEIGITQQVFDSVKVFVAIKCGIGFEDGKIPDKP